MSTNPRPLTAVKALCFDVFGTVVDWEGSVSKQLKSRADADGISTTSGIILQLTRDWRAGYMIRTREIAAGAPGPTNVDVLHLELLDEVLAKPEYSAFANAWDHPVRIELVQVWHRLDGWSDSAKGLAAIRDIPKGVLIGTLSNGSLKLLVDLGRHADLPWDFIFSGDLMKSYKPNKDMYLGACGLLSLNPEEVAMVAAHIDDLRAAKSFGLRTIYVPRTTEDKVIPGGPASIRTYEDGGEVDAVATEGLHQIPALLQ
ncbi:haloacid dehalogenase [Meredithblackwellia eburnea MCA 4105]